jgi:hypothetical protein
MRAAARKHGMTEVQYSELLAIAARQRDQPPVTALDVVVDNQFL